MSKKHKLLAIAGVSVVALPLASWVLFSGAPRWPLAGSFHYVADLNTTSFPVGSVWDNNAQWALSDWRDMGGTAFTPGFTRLNPDYNNHGDGRNAWVWLNRPGDSWLGITFVRWNGSTMTDCDIWYNSRPDYLWTNGLTDPCAYRPYWPVEFRNVARHETGHAIGFDHEDTTLANMNAISTHGAGIAHTTNSGMLPHANDKAGCRWLYPGSGTYVNVMSTCWSVPVGGQSPRLDMTGSWAAGTARNVEFWLENQSNVNVLGGSSASGVRVGIYLSTNTVISTGDTRIAEYWFSGDWPAHAQGYYNLSGTVPSTMTPGTYYVGVIFDSQGVVGEQWETDNASVVGTVSVTNVARMLSVQSVNPASGVPITVSLTDANGNKDGVTAFSRSYWNTSTVDLTAPAAVGFNPFKQWRLDGVPQGASNTVTVYMDAGHTAVAEYRLNVAGNVTTLGPGCRGTNGLVPLQSLSWPSGQQGPQQGARVNFNLSQARGSTQAVLFFGASKTNWGAFTLPLNMQFLGMTGCRLYHDIVISASILTTPSGTGTLSVVPPIDPGAVGADVYTTFFVVDFGANPASVVESNAIDLHLGGNL